MLTALGGDGHCPDHHRFLAVSRAYKKPRAWPLTTSLISPRLHVHPKL